MYPILVKKKKLTNMGYIPTHDGEGGNATIEGSLKTWSAIAKDLVKDGVERTRELGRKQFAPGLNSPIDVS